MKKTVFFGLNGLDLILWMVSLSVITGSFLLCSADRIGVLVVSLIGASALIFCAKGLPTGQILIILFALVYGWISWEFRYYGEMITYLGMSAPMAVLAAVSWFRNPYEEGKQTVKVRALHKKEFWLIIFLSILVTAFFGVILTLLSTPNLVWSIVSVFTSFLAASLTFLRSPYYALAYSANDLVLIVLWCFASAEDIAYIPMVACFIIFLINDIYGFANWKLMEKQQSQNSVPTSVS